MTKPYPVSDEGFKNIFPKLLSKDMPYIEMKLDEAGSILKSEKPMNVYLSLAL
jgi:hypothetical protein